jgi:hypothetical protein
LSVDPLYKKYPELTTYQFASNTPICAIDLDGLEASLSIESGVYFIKLDNVNISFVIRKSSEYFTTAVAGKDCPETQDYSINTQMYSAGTFSSYATARNPQPVDGYTSQGYNVEKGKIISGRSSPQTFYFAQSANSCKWSCGQGDVPADSYIGFGGGTPIFLNGMKYGETNIYIPGAPANLPTTGAVATENLKYLSQKSNGVYKAQNKKDLGKTILGYNSTKSQWIIVSQKSGTSGLTLDEIRDKLIGMGYDQILGFDGSTSSTLAQDKTLLVSPANYKNATMITGVTLSTPQQSAKPKPQEKKKRRKKH